MSDRTTWLEAYKRHSKHKHRDQDIEAMKVFDALENLVNCGHLTIHFERTGTQSQAIFRLKAIPTIELIRVVVHFKSERNVDFEHDRVVVGYTGNHPSHKKHKWSKEWEKSFEKDLQIRPQMRNAIVDWCVKSYDNTDRLIQWLISKAKEASRSATNRNFNISVVTTVAENNDAEPVSVMVEAAKSTSEPPQLPARSGTPRQADPLLRKRVEEAAILVVTKHYTELKYEVKSFEDDCVGWDLNAVRDSQLLRLEVKGLSGSDLVIELTPNEYAKMLEHRDSYHICIVSLALTEPKLVDFSYMEKSNRWESADGLILDVTPLVGARCRAT